MQFRISSGTCLLRKNMFETLACTIIEEYGREKYVSQSASSTACGAFCENIGSVSRRKKNQLLMENC